MTAEADPVAVAEFLRALSHPMRLQILQRLLEGELSVAGFESELGLKQPNLSQQLAALREANLVETRREAKSIFYRLVDGKVPVVLAAIGEAFGATPPAPRPTRPAQAAPPPAGECGVFALTETAG